MLLSCRLTRRVLELQLEWVDEVERARLEQETHVSAE
jgi:hypothetical protein